MYSLQTTPNNSKRPQTSPKVIFFGIFITNSLQTTPSEPQGKFFLVIFITNSLQMTLNGSKQLQMTSTEPRGKCFVSNFSLQTNPNDSKWLITTPNDSKQLQKTLWAPGKFFLVIFITNSIQTTPNKSKRPQTSPEGNFFFYHFHHKFAPNDSKQLQSTSYDSKQLQTIPYDS